MGKKYDSIIVTGSVAYDEIMDFPSQFVKYLQPEKLHQINVSFVVDKLEKQLGGTGTNIAYNLSLVTKAPIKLLAGVGKDARDFLTFFKKHRLATDGIFVDKRLYTATGKVITDTTDNQIWGFYYGACERGKDIAVSKYCDKNSLIIVSANHPKAFLHAQKEAVRLKLPYLYDPGMVLTWISDTDLKKGINNCTFLVGNDYEISAILKRVKTTIPELHKKGIAVIATLGEKGVTYQDNKQKYTVSALKVKKVVDPTGAGDAWRAGFVGALCEGKTIEDALKLGNVLASFAIEKYGTVNHKPTRKEIEKRLQQLNNY